MGGEERGGGRRGERGREGGEERGGEGGRRGGRGREERGGGRGREERGGGGGGRRGEGGGKRSVHVCMQRMWMSYSLYNLPMFQNNRQFVCSRNVLIFKLTCFD